MTANTTPSTPRESNPAIEQAANAESRHTRPIRIFEIPDDLVMSVEVVQLLLDNVEHLISCHLAGEWRELFDDYRCLKLNEDAVTPNDFAHVAEQYLKLGGVFEVLPGSVTLQRDTAQVPLWQIMASQVEQVLEAGRDQLVAFDGASPATEGPAG